MTERQREFVPGRRSKDGETEGVCSRQKDQRRRDRGSLFQAEGPKTEKEQVPTIESLVRGILRRKASNVERRVHDSE